MAEIHSLSPGVLLLYGALFSSGIIVVRMLWIYGETYLIYGYQKWFRKSAVKAPQPRELFVLGWGGMRGVLSLAAAVSLPFVRSNGEPFQQRSMIVFLAFCVIVATLVVQGLTMPWVIRVLNLSKSNGSDEEEQYARRTLLEEALAYLKRRRSSERYEAGTLRDLVSHYQRRLDAMPIELPESYARTSSRSERQALVLEVLKVERQALLRLRDEGHISDEVLRSIQRELDLSESHVHTGSLFSVDS
nr:NhaP-type Na+/H+ and K+/H+ antiporter [uncultured bacterium]